MNPLGAVILVVLILVVTCASRRVALLGMMAGVLYLTQSQQITVAGFNLYAIRFLELVGFIRVMIRKEFSFTRLNGIDRSVFWLYGFSTVIYLLRSSEGQAYQIGVAVDAFLAYFTFRGLIESIDEFQWFLGAMLVLLAPYMGLLVLERLTGHNWFTLLGGVESGYFMRDDRPRCFGSFRHPSLLGTLGASFLPLYIGLAFIKAERIRAYIGIGLCVGIVWASNSGGPMSSAAFAVVGWLFWKQRTKMRRVRWALVGMIALAALVMKAPVWYLLARVSSLTGGDGWHRSYLIDMCFQHLDVWWLAGVPIRETSGWFPYDLGTTGGADITNEFISFGITAGLLAMALFILMLARALSRIGKATANIRSRSPDPSETEFFLWGLGVMVVVHIVNWLGITYFDQTYMIWFMQLAAVSNLTEKYFEMPALEVTDADTAPAEKSGENGDMPAVNAVLQTRFC